MRAKPLRHLNAQKVDTLEDVKRLMNGELLPRLHDLVDAVNRELVPAILTMERDLDIVASSTVERHTADVEASPDVSVYIVDATAGGVTVTLPDPTLAWQAITVKKVDASVNFVTLAGTIDGGAFQTLITQYESMTVVSDGAQFWAI